MNNLKVITEFCDCYHDLIELTQLMQANPSYKIAYMERVSEHRDEDWYVVYEGDLTSDYAHPDYKFDDSEEEV